MTNFKWEISDASDDSIQGYDGGQIELEQLKPARGQAWDVGPPGSDLTLEPINGGTIEKLNRIEHVVRKSPTDVKAYNSYSLLKDKEVIRAVVLFVTLLLGYGFLAVIDNEIKLGRLDLTTYINLLVVILTATGIVSAVKSSRMKDKPDGGSG
jgi:hypothetical protein